MESILLFFITGCLKVLEEFILCSDFMMVLKMIDHLAEVMRESLKVDLARDGTPPKVVM